MRAAVHWVESLEKMSSFAANDEPAQRIRIVAVDGDDCFRDMLSNELSERAFSVTSFADSASVLASTDALSAADLIVLDWGLAGKTGLDLLRQLKRLGINIPTVVLAGRSLASYESLALEHGALDFIDKSRGMSILAHRLRIVARAKVPGEWRDKILRLGGLTLKTPISRAFWNDSDVELTVGEFKIVNLLAGNVGRHVTYREIYDALHHQGFVAADSINGYRTNVRSAIKRIRRKFEALDPTFDRIQNYTAFGYIWARD
jgi:two-component system response regulator ChvI